MNKKILQKVEGFFSTGECISVCFSPKVMPIKQAAL